MAETASVRVYVRARPALPGEIGLGQTNCLELETGSEASIRVKKDGEPKRFFRRVWGPNTSQEDVWREVGLPSVSSVFEGYDATVLVYGQTGSGKTFTLSGTPDQGGIQPRAIEDIFRRVKSESSTHCGEVEAKYVQLYRDHVLDLLDIARNRLNIRVDDKVGVTIEGCTSTICPDAKTLRDVVDRGNRNRATANTRLNSCSSRSHACLIVTVRRRPHGTVAGGPEESLARLNLLDLAGSERVSKSGAHGEVYKEAVAINRSLTVLGTCIHGLVNQDKHISFRDSKLTRILQPCLSGKGRTSVVVTVPPGSASANETISTLRFGERALKVQAQMTIGDYCDALRVDESSLTTAQDREGDATAELRALERATQQAHARLAALKAEAEAARQARAQELGKMRTALESEFASSDSRHQDMLQEQRAEHERALEALRAAHADTLKEAEQKHDTEQQRLQKEVADFKADQEARLARVKARGEDVKASAASVPNLPDEAALREKLQDARRRVGEQRAQVRDMTVSSNRGLSAGELRRKERKLKAKVQRLNHKARQLQVMKQEQDTFATAARLRKAPSESDQTVTASNSSRPADTPTEELKRVDTLDWGPVSPRVLAKRAHDAASGRPEDASSDIPSSAASAAEKDKGKTTFNLLTVDAIAPLWSPTNSGPVALRDPHAKFPGEPSSSSSSSSFSSTTLSTSGTGGGAARGGVEPPKLPTETPQEKEEREERELFKRVEVRQFRNATRRETHLHHLVERILMFLEYGVPMTQVLAGKSDESPLRFERTGVYIQDRNTSTTVACCKLDENGQLQREERTVLFELRDVKFIYMGQNQGRFRDIPSPRRKPDGGAKMGRRGKLGLTADPDKTLEKDPDDEFADELTVQNVQDNFYRSLTLQFGRESYLDLIADNEMDFEAWIVALHKLTRIDPLWAEPMDIDTGFPRSKELNEEEAEMCEENHITPEKYLEAKEGLLVKPSVPRMYLTLYDVRSLSECDLFHSQKIFEFFHEQGWIEKKPVQILTLVLKDALRQAHEQTDRGLGTLAKMRKNSGAF
eukprot:Hpha_TRINITY_DN10320_c0_g1::TRINITY_DN10320_c0_g1_i1::g.116094::m.116094/K10396/KIF5; kinesin family member 5